MTEPRANEGWNRRLRNARRLRGVVLTLSVVLGSMVVTSKAHALRPRLYIKRAGVATIAIDDLGDFYTRSVHQGAATTFKIKRNGTTLFTVGAPNADDDVEFGAFGYAGSFTANTVPPGAVNSLVVKRNGVIMTELTPTASVTSRALYIYAFGFRQNFVFLHPIQRTDFIDTINALDGKFWPGVSGQADPPGGGYNKMGAVSYWDKVAQMHDMMFPNIHGGVLFLPWHRFLLNWMEDLMREVDPLTSIPYWDWTFNPVTEVPLVGPGNPLGAHTGRVGSPFAGLDNNNVLAGSHEEHCPEDQPHLYSGEPLCNPAKPPQMLDRYVDFMNDPPTADDESVYVNTLWEDMRRVLENNAHNLAHQYLGTGGMGEIHAGRSPMDPMFWLLHSNCDRIWRQWQLLDIVTREWDPETAYGSENDDPGSILRGIIEPWANGATFWEPTQGMRPWSIPDDQDIQINYMSPEILHARLFL